MFVVPVTRPSPRVHKTPSVAVRENCPQGTLSLCLPPSPPIPRACVPPRVRDDDDDDEDDTVDAFYLPNPQERDYIIKFIM